MPDIAYKLSISQILNSEFVKDEGWQPSYILLNGRKIFRVNVIGIVVDSAMVLDDGSGTIMLKFIQHSFSPGDIIQVIGRPRLHDVKYIIPEIMRKIDLKWLSIRRLETNKINAESFVKEEPVDMSYEKIIESIKILDKGYGINIIDIKSKFSDIIIDDLVKKGEIFEISPGTFKVLE